MRRLGLLSIVAGLVFAVSPAVIASVITMEQRDFNDLLGGQVTAIGAPQTAPLSNGPLLAEMVSQAFTDGAGNYLYLYQVNNTGHAGNDYIDTMTLSPLVGADAGSIVGYLTANAPAGFTLGTQAPAGASVNLLSGPTVSFGFPSWNDGQINPGASSKTLYIVSKNAPGMITGNVINGVVASTSVVGPIPEPASLALLVMGTLGLLRRRK